jgi:hypothetical protein
MLAGWGRPELAQRARLEQQQAKQALPQAALPELQQAKQALPQPARLKLQRVELRVLSPLLRPPRGPYLLWARVLRKSPVQRAPAQPEE